MARETSIEAYNKLVRSGKEKTQRALILNLILYSSYPLTRQEICFGTGLAINAVCGRIHALLEAGLIEEIGKGRCTITGFNANHIAPVAGESQNDG